MPIVNLTAAFVESLKRRPPASGRVEIWDEKTPGLLLRVSATGAGSWCFRYRPRSGGGFQRVTLGSIGTLSLAEARDRAARHKLEVRDGADPQRALRARREAVENVFTFDRLADRYLAEYAKPRKASWRNDELYLKRPRAAWDGREAKAITRRDVIALLDQIKATAPVSANRTQSILVTVFNWAVEDELLDVNPIAGLKKRAKEQAKDRALSDDELGVLWRALEAPAGISTEVAAALRMILLTGQRPGEIAGMMMGELVALAGPDARWEIPAERTKARRAHVVPLAPMALALLTGAVAPREGRRGGIGEVFASRFTSRTTLARHSLSQGLARVIDGLEPVEEAVRTLKAVPPTPHDFRRTVATGLARLGIPREDRLAVLGHAPDDVHGKHYDKYARLREKRVALEAWERHVSDVVFGAASTATVVPIIRGRS